MKIVYLASAVRDISWFRYYYQSVFPEGSKAARERIQVIEQHLAANPYLGHTSPLHSQVRELHISRTPFSLIYRVTDTQIEILRLWDERQGEGY